MEHIRKTWGRKMNVYKDDLSEMSILYLEPNRRCSLHYHRAKANRFYVIEGTVGILSMFGTDEGIEEAVTILEKGMMPFDVYAPDGHEFQTYDEPCVLLEVMYVKYDPNDIVRSSVGGTMKENTDSEGV